MATIFHGMDISRYQGSIDFRLPKEDGITAIYVKSTQGDSYVDPYFPRNASQAEEYGYRFGFYHYVTASTAAEAQAEADFFYERIREYRFHMRPAMDFESFGSLSAQEVRVVARAFLERLQERSCIRPVIYSDIYSAENLFGAEFRDYPLWIASYGAGEPGRGLPWETWAGWQFTDQGRVAGVNAPVDLDLFREEILR